jgi:hypothetical protein
MSTVTLAILNPAHNALIVGPAAAAAVQLQGQVTDSAPATLFYKWYDSLYSPAGISSAADAPKAALNFPNHGPAALNFPVPASLAIGSHTITLTAKDVEGDSLAEVESVQEAGMAGGPAADNVASPCVIHVLVATMLAPAISGPVPTLGKAGSTLEAQAPLKWSDANYQAVNRVRFRWRFEPPGGGAPVAGLPPLAAGEAAIAQFQQQLHFGPPDGGHLVPFVRYQGPLPAELVVGNSYRLVLRVEDTNPPHTGHEVSRLVIMGA